MVEELKLAKNLDKGGLSSPSIMLENCLLVNFLSPYPTLMEKYYLDFNGPMSRFWNQQKMALVSWIFEKIQDVKEGN